MPQVVRRAATHVGHLLILVVIIAAQFSVPLGASRAQTIGQQETLDMLRQIESLARHEELKRRRPYLLSQLAVYYSIGAAAYDDARRLYRELPSLADTITNEYFRGYFISSLDRLNREAGPPGESLVPTESQVRTHAALADLKVAAGNRQISAILAGLKSGGLERNQAHQVLDALRRAITQTDDLEAAHALIPHYPDLDSGERLDIHLRDIRIAAAKGRADLARLWTSELEALLEEREERSRPHAANVLVKLGLIAEARALAGNAKSNATRAATWAEIALVLMAEDSPLGVPLASELLLGKIEHVSFEQLTDVVVPFDHAVTEWCKGPSKRTPSIDARRQYVPSSFMDCGYTAEDSAAMALALGVYKRTSATVAADTLVRIEREARRRPHPVVSTDVDNGFACLGYQHSLDFTQPYLAAGAGDIVRSYLSDIMRECSMRLYDASRIAKHLTMLGSRHVVEERVLRERQVSPGSKLIDPLLGGILEGVTASGDVGEMEKAFTALEQSGLALAHLLWGIEDYSVSPQNFAIEQVLSKAMSLYIKHGHLAPRLGVYLAALAVDRRLSTLMADGLATAEKLLVRDINRDHERHDILALASLQLLALQSGPTPDVRAIAGRIQRDRERHAFLSLCVDALVSLGRLDEAQVIAELIPHSPSDRIDAVFEPSYYAWTRIAEGLARQGKLVEAFKLGILDKKAASLDRLVGEWEEATGVHLSKRLPPRNDN